jgi:hypothetical protein
MPHIDWDRAVRALRFDAAGAWRLASSFSHRETADDLRKFAEALEEQARELESAGGRPASRSRRFWIFE